MLVIITDSFETGDFIIIKDDGTALNFQYYNNCLINIKPEIGIPE